MIGRATRRCDDIGKTVFKIYDPVDLYAGAAAVNTMQPLVKRPQGHARTAARRAQQPAEHSPLPGSGPGRSHAHDVLDQLNQKLMRVLRRAEHQADKKPALKDRLDELEQQWGVPPPSCTSTCTSSGQLPAADWLRNSTRLLAQLGEVQPAHDRHHLQAHHLRPRGRTGSPRAKLGRLPPSPMTTSTASTASCASNSTSPPRWPLSSTAPKT
jgi:type I restriction enzyme R subunit